MGFSTIHNRLACPDSASTWLKNENIGGILDPLSPHLNPLQFAFISKMAIGKKFVSNSRNGNVHLMAFKSSYQCFHK